MKILFLAHSFPYPPDEGIKLMSYNLIKEFSKKNKVILLSFINQTEKKYIKNIRNFCEILETVEHTIPRSFFNRCYNLLFEKNPFFTFQFFSEDFVNKLNKLIDETKPDVIHFDFIDTIMYIDYIKKDIPCIFFPHDAFSMYLYGNISGEKKLFRKFYTFLQYKRTVRYEKIMLPKFDKIVVVSPRDKQWLNKLLPDINISVIPNGVDCDYFKPMDIEKDHPSLIFRGIMDFLPNVDAVVYFYNVIFPLIKKRIPEIKFYIVGKNPTKEILKFSKDNSVIVTGYVEDIRPYLAKSTVNVCPMRIGSGIKNKILESMAMGVPSVATSIACAGIDVKDGENIFIADTPIDFVNRVCMLINNKDLWKIISKNSREFVIKNYTWKRAAENFEKIYREAIC